MDPETDSQVDDVETPAVASETAGQVPAPSGSEPVSETLEVSTSKLTPQQAQDALKAARQEAAARRTEVKRLRQEQQETAKKLDEATRQLTAVRTLAVQSAVQSQAADFVDPLGAYARIQTKIELGADGLPKNIPQLLDELRKSQPDLLRPSRPRVGLGNHARTDDSSEAAERAAAVQEILRRAGLKKELESPLFDRDVALQKGGGTFVSPISWNDEEAEGQ